jgi:hypothetical protein
MEAIGKMAALPEDISPIQIGTTLVHAGRTHTVIGRYIMAWADGRWTEWFIDDGTAQGWLAHAQGFFAVAFESPLQPDLAARAWPALDDEVAIDGTTYSVADLLEATCIGAEGELPFPAVPGRVIHYADMLGPGAEFASLELADDKRTLFVGTYAAFDDLNFAGLRPLEGWKVPAPGQARRLDPQFPPAR